MASFSASKRGLSFADLVGFTELPAGDDDVEADDGDGEGEEDMSASGGIARAFRLASCAFALVASPACKIADD